MKKPLHPSLDLIRLIEESSMSQRELASLISVSPSVLNGILVHKKPISAEIAIKLESAGFGKARKWIINQALYELNSTMDNIGDETDVIKQWNQVKEIIPVNFFKKKGFLGSDNNLNLNKIFEIFNTDNLDQFKKLHDNYSFSHYRKSSAFQEQKNNVISWSVLAEYIVKDQKVSLFKKDNQEKLIKELNKVFYENPESLINDVKLLLAKNGVKFEILDRPTKTPVDGKSFMSVENPAIVLSLKYKRLDNFAFTVMHELGHVFLHLSENHKEESFFINSSQNDILEFEANQFARNALIRQDLWESFESSSDVYSDKLIISFANKNKIHPAIVRGRVCFEYNNYYRRKSSITQTNVIAY